MKIEPKVLDDVTARLRRVQGQVGGIVRMIEEGRDCREVVQQISAASKALDQAGFRLLASGLRTCVRAPGSRNGVTADEIERLFMTLA